MEEITIESITTTVETPDKLSDEQKTFLTEHAQELEDDVATKYGIVKPPIEAKPITRTGYEPPVQTTVDDTIDEEDKKKIGKVATEVMAPLLAQQRAIQDQVEVDSFIQQNAGNIPNISKYRSAMLTYMKTPGFEKVTARDIFNIVAGNDLMKLGAQKEREAAAKAGGTVIKSNSARPTGATAGKDWGNASKEEYAAKRAEILGQSN